MSLLFLKNKRTIKGIATVVLLVFIAFTKTFGQEIPGPAVELSTEQIASYKKQAIKSIHDLESYIQVIANKTSSMEKKNSATGLALDLFQSDTTTIEVSSLKPSKNNYLMKVYLKTLRLLPYTSVKIQWYKVYMGSTFTKGPDGNYYGTATFYQRFEGRSNNEMGPYRDITKKSIQIVLKKVEAYRGTEKINDFVLKLGDIKVDETTVAGG